LSIEKSGLGQKEPKPLKQRLLVFRFALPNGQYAPSQLLQLLPLTLVAKPIRLQFGRPIIELGLRRLTLAAPMRMPKTPMHKYGCSPLPEYQIRLPRKIASMKSITVSGCVKQATNDPFWTCIFRANGLHYSPPLFARSRIGHARALEAPTSEG
jgi:hypothetical protein